MINFDDLRKGMELDIHTPGKKPRRVTVLSASKQRAIWQSARSGRVSHCSRSTWDQTTGPQAALAGERPAPRAAKPEERAIAVVQVQEDAKRHGGSNAPDFVRAARERAAYEQRLRDDVDSIEIAARNATQTLEELRQEVIATNKKLDAVEKAVYDCSPGGFLNAILNQATATNEKLDRLIELWTPEETTPKAGK